MAEVRWTGQAADDLESIVSFIARDSPHYASHFATRMLEVVERLEPFPKSGRIVPELDDPEIREIIHGNYRIIDRVRDGATELLTILHGARMLDVSRFGRG